MQIKHGCRAAPSGGSRRRGAASMEGRMAKKRIKQPTQIHDEALDDVNGGLIGLLVPAVQKVRDAAVAPDTLQTQTTLHSGGVNVAMGDGSVRKV